MTKYKVLSAEVNKNLENDTLVLSKVSGYKNASNKKTSKNQAPLWFSSWVENSFEPRMNDLETTVKDIKTDINNIVNLNNLKR